MTPPKKRQTNLVTMTATATVMWSSERGWSVRCPCCGSVKDGFDSELDAMNEMRRHNATHAAGDFIEHDGPELQTSIRRRATQGTL